MDEQALPGGNAGGAVRVGDTVRRETGPWTPAIHALLAYLQQRGFPGVPRPLGTDAQGREVLSFLPGETVGERRPWPAWPHSDDALAQVGRWLRRYHDVVADFVPEPGLVWRMARRGWQPGDVIGHNDAAPYNAVWRTTSDGSTELVGFFDWDFAGPGSAVQDLAFVAFSWVPLHARSVVAAEGFTRFDDRPARLRLLLDAYGWGGSVADVLVAVRTRVLDHIAGLELLAGAGEALFAKLVADGAVIQLQAALRELEDRWEWYLAGS